MRGKIASVHGREIIDSRGNPTVEADVVTEEGLVGRAAVPSGASTGTHEALELRDGDRSRFNGRGVTRAVAGINGEISRGLKDFNVCSQRALDERLIELDGSDDKSRLGANALLAVSLALAKAGCLVRQEALYNYLAGLFPGREMRLPVPLINILNGGSHAGNNIDIQEFMVVPAGAHSMAEAVRMGAEIFFSLKKILENEGHATTVGDEGGLAPDLQSSEAAIECVIEAVCNAGYEPGKDVWLAIDAASSEFYRDGHYHFESESSVCTSRELIDRYEAWGQRYPLLSIEDGLAEDDWEGWQLLTERIGSRVQLVGDDLFVTNVNRIQKGVSMKAANSVLIKPNQIGTLSETFDAIDIATGDGYTCIVSHRSGETEDVTIADLAVATGVGQIKTGSLSRTDRVAKYNQLIRIEEALDGECPYEARAAFGMFLKNRD